MKILPPSGSRSKAENKIRDCIKSLPSKSSEVALWSLHVPNHASKEFSEVDFILLTRKGICFIEVKGGRVEYKDGRFIFIDRWGNKNAKSEGPIQQVAGNKKAIQNKLFEKFPSLKICLAHCAIFPDCRFKADEEIFEDEPYLILDGENYHDDPNLWFENFIKKVFKRFKEHRSYKNSKELSDEDLKKIRKYLRSNIIGVKPLVDIAKEVDAQIYKATEEQLDYLETITDEFNPRILCRGPAGSGKTILAVQTAIHFKNKNKEVCFLVRNKSFKEYLQKISGDLFDIICLEEDFDSSKKYDFVIVDEGQDMLNFDSIQKFESILKNPLKDSNVYWFMDMNNQSHLYEDFDEEWVNYFKGNFHAINLSKNCRNPIEIIKTTNSIAGTELKGNKEARSEKTKIFDVKSNEKEEHARVLEDALGYFFEKSIRPDEITILTFGKHEESCVNYLQNMASGVAKINDLDPELDKVKFFDILNFKGQENNFVILVDLYSNERNPFYENQFYTGLTRAKVQACIVKHHSFQLNADV